MIKLKLKKIFIIYSLVSTFIISGPLIAQISTNQLLDTLQHTAFNFFWQEANPTNGLIKDRSATGAQSSIASVGFGLTAICIGADHGWISREAARDRVLTTLRTFITGPQGTGQSGYIGYKGFYYHFLDMNTATRTWNSELSTIDSGLLFAGILYVKQYFDGSDSNEVKIRALSDSIYYRADWEWFRNYNPGLLMGWNPGTGFLNYGQWIGYCEAMIMYILGYGSPTHSIKDKYGWDTWTSGYQWQTKYGFTYIIFPPLFGHQYSHCWIDFRNIADAYTRNKGIDYFENSRRATLAQHAYCVANPGGFVGYGDSLWGITASDVQGGYSARGAPPPQDDDGTLVPTAPISSLPFAPEIVIPTIRNMWNAYHSQLWMQYGFRDAFNLTINWWDSDVIGIDQGPIIIMIENYRNGSVWNRFMQNADIQRGLKRVGFQSTSSVEEKEKLPLSFSLFQNYPNPFNGETMITYSLPSAGYTRLAVYDELGREICFIKNENALSGINSVSFRSENLASGVYQYRLDWEGKIATKRFILIK
jgi:hypothetical protein